MNYDSCLAGQAPDQSQQVIASKRDTTRRWTQPRTGNVNEDGAAAPRRARPRIVVDFDDKIIEFVIAAKPIAWFTGRPVKWPVIAAVGWVLAPSVVEADRTHRQECSRPSQTIGPPPQPDWTKPPGGRAAVAFALIGLDSGATERHPHWPPGAGYQPTLGATARAGAEVEET
jgi:hypothetical protein